MTLRGVTAIFISALCLSSCNWPEGNPDASGPLADGVLDAGYIPYPPSLIVDPNSGEFSGISYDVLEEIADRLGVELDPDEELAWGTMIENLNAGRSEIVATGIWPTPERDAQADFSNPIFYSPVYAYVRADDNRFDGNLQVANQPNITISILDGEVAESIAREDFAQASELSLPQISQVSELLLNVQNGKADVTFVEPAIAQEFLDANPGSIKRVEGIEPVRAFPTTFMVPDGEQEFLAELNRVLAEMQQDGTVNRIIDRYEEHDGSFIRVSDFAPTSN
ncbi:MAG: transporter substrate-binding domain-containing protein [Pseudomonadota bacterium]